MHLNGAAQIILALLAGGAALLKAFTLFLPVWRQGRQERTLERIHAELVRLRVADQKPTLPAK
jgi:hypothetical protein